MGLLSGLTTFNPSTEIQSSPMNTNFASITTFVNSRNFGASQIEVLAAKLEWVISGTDQAMTISSDSTLGPISIIQSTTLNANGYGIKILDSAAQTQTATVADFFINCTHGTHSIPCLRLDVGTGAGVTGDFIQCNSNAVKMFSVEKDGDVYIKKDLDVDGSADFAGTVTANIIGLPTGVIMDYMGKVSGSAPAGWVFCRGLTLSKASSGGTERANADCSALYEFLWNNTADADCPVLTGRGASGAADFAAGKQLTMPGGAGYFRRTGTTDAPGKAEADATAINGVTVSNSTQTASHTHTVASVPNQTHRHATPAMGGARAIWSEYGGGGGWPSGVFANAAVTGLYYSRAYGGGDTLDTSPTIILSGLSTATSTYTTATQSASHSHTTTVASTDTETRPMNFYVSTIIKL